MNRNSLEQLQNIGLSEKESLVYLFLIQSNGTTAGAISSTTGIARPTVYMTLTSLAIKGLVSEVKGKSKKFFIPEHPQILERIAGYKVTLANESLDSAQKAIPHLSQLFMAFQQESKVTFYEGEEGVRNIFMRHVAKENKNSELRAFINLNRLTKFMPKKFFREYVKRKEELNITGRGIAPESQRDFEFLAQTHFGVDKKYYPKIRYTTESVYSFEGEILLFGKNQISFLSLLEDKPTAILVQDQGTYDMLSAVFELAWLKLE